jgi:phenylacetate-CoA ligase
LDAHAFFIRTLIGPLWARWEGSPYLRHLSRLRQTQYDDRQTIASRQWTALQHLLQHAYETVPFYRERFDQAGLRVADIKEPSDYQRLPVLTKADLRQNAARLRSTAYDPATLCRKKTSGSTGVSLEVWVDDPSMQWKRACTARSDEWSGWRFGERVGMIWGNPEYLHRGWRGRLRNAVLEREYYLDTLKMDTGALGRFAALLLRKQPPLLFGHAHSVYLFAEFVHQRGIRGIRPRGIITSAMVLHSWQRAVIEEVFDCKVTNRYGCEEVGLIACECEQHNGLHINADNVVVETVRDAQPAGFGQPGSVVLTDLTNRAMPLLRYQVGDVATLTDRRCPCGRGLPLLERIEGREADYVVTSSGELISGISLTENFALQVPGVAQIQILQDAVDRFRFRVMRGPDFGPDSLVHMEQVVRSRFGSAVTYTLEYVDAIPAEPSGKYRFCISRVANPFTRTELRTAT